MLAAAITLLLLSAAGHQAGSAAVNSDDNLCIDGEICVPSIDCKNFIWTDLEAAKNRTCGYVGINPQVCCKEGDIMNGSTNPSSSPKPLQPNQQTISFKCKFWNENGKKLFTHTATQGVSAEQEDKLNFVIFSNWLECSRNPILPPRIFGGEVLGINEHPWLAIIYKLIEGRDHEERAIMKCGGSLIFSRYVITAAHCVTDLAYARNKSKVRLGEWDVDSTVDCQNSVCSAKPEDVAIEDVIVHPSYRSSSADQAHDIAILKLARAVTYTEWLKPVCLPIPSWTSGEYYTASGWGKTEFGQYSQVKRQVSLKHVAPDICSVSFPSINLTNVICAGGRLGEDTCNGDSGSSLVSEMKDGMLILMGITSVGLARCGTAGSPGIYTRVSSYISWIADNIDLPMCANL